MIAHRKLDRRRDDPYVGGLHKRVQESLIASDRFLVNPGAKAILAQS
jgi:hypothetical protein